MPLAIGTMIDDSGIDAIINQSSADLDAVVSKVAHDTEGDIKNNFSSSSPSAAGEAPAVDTGALKNSINTTKIADAHYEVHDGVEYGVHLEFGTEKMAARPFMLPAAERSANRGGDSLVIQVVKDFD